MKRWLLVALVTPLVAGCGSPPARDGGRAGGAGDEAAAITSHKCARCHAPPERFKHTRAKLELALLRHRDRARVKLTAEQWQAVVDFLARPDEGVSSK